MNDFPVKQKNWWCRLLFLRKEQKTLPELTSKNPWNTLDSMRSYCRATLIIYSEMVIGKYIIFFLESCSFSVSHYSFFLTTKRFVVWPVLCIFEIVEKNSFSKWEFSQRFSIWNVVNIWLRSLVFLSVKPWRHPDF